MNLEIDSLDLISWQSHQVWSDLITNSNGEKYYYFKEKHFDFNVIINPKAITYYFESCYFEKGVRFETAFRNEAGETINHYKRDIQFINCRIDDVFDVQNSVFDKKFRIHDSEVNKVSFRNTTFNDLADFWFTKFNKKVNFFKTDFNATAVFSMATFKQNVLFTYTLLAGKTIFSRTTFSKGLDVSQAIISGELKPFDLRFDFKNYTAEYVGGNDELYQKYIDKQGIVPLVNKVHTFQVLKKSFEDIGNYADSIIMNREEKKAFRILTKERLNDNKVQTNNKFVLWFKRRSIDFEKALEKIFLEGSNIDTVNTGDKVILWLNRLSNNYQSDFRNGIWFTLLVTILFGSVTLFFTSAFQNNICFYGCEFNDKAFTKGIKFLFNFLNPTRSLTYLDSLKPTFYGIAYFFDFLGRLAVGYGLYQTIQAFRKFK